MTTSSPLAWLVRLVRRRPAPPPDVLDPYAAAVLPLTDRAEALYHEWFEHTALVADSEKLANAAAIHRWEAATLARRLEGIAPPAELEDDHDRLVEAVHLASRAAQLLSSGSRYHNANALCEGQMLLTESRSRQLKALARLRRFLAERPPAAEQPPDTPAAPGSAPAAPGSPIDGSSPRSSVAMPTTQVPAAAPAEPVGVGAEPNG